ncbi:hypothetical protein J5U18_13635 [Sphingobacteriaceae bacterium WQ 2009]|uniref:Tail specific protease domain-containing protein n=1 Tax=Rhinopithecimicrobium faecis TaxID=2820698 RepID=A0A8T4HE33_9SPHI|nr:hypothetical protein [Sphingobacteriaceae bacterium WQ 2009]
MLASSLYLWNDQLPPYSVFNPKKYLGLDLEQSIQNSVNYISSFATDSQTNLLYEQYAYPLNIKDKIKYSTFLNKNEQSLQNTNFGMKLGVDKTSGEIRVMYVLPNSPADRSGIKRSYLLEEINGIKIQGIRKSASFVAKILKTDERCSFVFKNKNGLSIYFDLRKNLYISSPILKDTVFEHSGKQIGYLLLHSFPSASAIRTDLDNVFRKFNKQHLEGLIVDLRYNGGGNISSARYLANLIAPRSINGKKMYSLIYNKNLREGKFNDLSRFYVRGNNEERIKKETGSWMTFADYDFSVEENTHFFNKKGNLNSLKKIVFIVSEHTASASEMLINSLKPYMNVSLVGQKTYGKPVGFFAVPIGKYNIFLSSFLTTNAEGNAKYFQGMPVDVEALDDFNYDFMDFKEDCFYSALSEFNLKLTKARSLLLKKKKTIKMLNVEPINNLLNDDITSVPYSK